MSTRLLLLEDDPAIARTVAYALERDGLQVTHCLLVQDARQQMQRHPFDLLVLDVGLPDGNGLDLLRDVRHGQAAAALRLRQATPVLMLSARGEELDRVLGLELGADDYLAKPFSPRELLARIKTILRRAQSLPANMEIGDARGFRFAGWRLDVATRNATAPDGLVVPLSGAEYRLLRVFLEHPQRVLPRDQLLELANKREAILFDRSIDVLVGRLRRRLMDDSREPALIKTVRGEGYVLAALVDVER